MMHTRRILTSVQGLLLIGLVFAGSVPAATSAPLKAVEGFDMTQVERGRYLARVAGCNDCHTAGYLPSDGQVAEQDWFTGDRFGWRGPWGTTYASNLRILVHSLTEEQWVSLAKVLRTRPPMPWFNLNAMHDEDLRAVYQFIRYLGPKGEAAPAYLSPDIEPKPPYALFPPAPG